MVVRVALAQINTTVGDVWGNAEKAASALERATEAGAQLVALPELTITGYPPEDLLMRPSFIKDNLRALEEFAGEVPAGVVAAIGFVDLDADLHNACAVDLRRRGPSPLPQAISAELRRLRREPLLPRRLGRPHPEVRRRPRRGEHLRGHLVPWRARARAGSGWGRRDLEHLGLALPPAQGRLPGADACGAGLRLRLLRGLLQPGGRAGRARLRRALARIRPEGDLISRASQFEEDLLVVDLYPEEVLTQRLHESRPRKESAEHPPEIVSVPGYEDRTGPVRPRDHRVERLFREEGEVFEALVLGLRDYFQKNGFSRAVLGLSGGVDSSLCAVVASRALGPQNVTGVLMPSRYTSEASNTDAEAVAKNLGIDTQVVPIGPAFDAYMEMLEGPFKGLPEDTTEENLQARIRGNIIMAFSNKFGWIALATGNKSELSVGYATLYGDMAGGFAVIKDVPKTLVYRICRYVNETEGARWFPSRSSRRSPRPSSNRDSATSILCRRTRSSTPSSRRTSRRTRGCARSWPAASTRRTSGA